MIIAQIFPDMTKGLPMFLVSAGALLWITNELFKLAKNVRGKTPAPANEQLGQAHGVLVKRVDGTEYSIRRLHVRIDGVQEKLSSELQERTAEIVAAGDRRGEAVTNQFKEVAASLARLEERTKNL